MAILSAYYSTKGTTRPTNQDALIIRSADTDGGPLVMAAVCDGMGGRARGELASATAVRLLSEFENDLPPLLRKGYAFPALRGSIEAVIRRISLTLENYSENHGIKLGTTLTMLLLYAGHCVTANVGDSRIYAVGNDVRQLTRDHSVVQRGIDIGAIDPKEAWVDNRRNILYQCLGESEGLEPDILEQRVSPSDIFLLCSDGLWHYLDLETARQELCACLPGHGDGMQAKLSELAHRVMEQGETDNITAVAVGLV